MGLLRSEVVFQAASGIPKDSVRATFWFNTAGTPPTVADMTEAGLRIVDFYTTPNAGSGFSLGQKINQSVSRGALVHEIRHYDGAAIGPPLLVTNFSIAGALTSDSMPNEIAVAFTYHADMTGVPEFAAGIRPRSRLRGRLYFGPLVHHSGTISVTAAPSLRARVGAELINDLGAAGSRMLGTASPLTNWVVYSRTVGIGFPVVGGWIDDAFDVQRRRGQDAVGRQTWA